MGDCFGQKPHGGASFANRSPRPQITTHRGDATCANAVRESICLCHGFTTRDRFRKAAAGLRDDRNTDRSHHRPRWRHDGRGRVTRMRGAYLPHPLCLTLGTCGQAACTPREHGQAHRPVRGQAFQPGSTPRADPTLHVLRLAGSPYSPASPCLSAIWLMS